MSTMKPGKKVKLKDPWGEWHDVTHLVPFQHQLYTQKAIKNKIYSVRVQRWRSTELNILDHETALRFSICRIDGKPIRGAHWRDIQQIKHDAGYGDYWACEWYPPDERVIDPANVYYLTLFPHDHTLPAHCGLVGIDETTRGPNS